MSEQQQYIDAFSLHPDHVLISGSIQEVEHGLETSQNTGKTCYDEQLFKGRGEFVSHLVNTRKTYIPFFIYFGRIIRVHKKLS